MIRKQLLYGKEIRNKLASGSHKLAQAVVCTLGPLSRNFIVDREYPAPIVWHDGISIAESIRLKDKFEDMGLMIVKEAAARTNALGGDGTTTATLLADTLIQEGMKLIDSDIREGVIRPAINPMILKEKLEGYSTEIIEKLEKMSKKIKTRKEIEQVATISAASPEIGKLIADAIDKVGKEGVILVEEGTDYESSLVLQEGMEFDNGWLSPYFVTNPNKMIAEYKQSYVLLTDMSIADGMDLVPIIESVIKEGGGKKALLIIAADVVGPAKQALVLTKLRSQVPLVAVMAPGYADSRKSMLEDLAVLLGANVISPETGKSLKDVTIADLGKAKMIRVTETSTSLVPQYPDSEELQERIATLKEQIKEETNPMKKEKLQKRMAKLSQGVAIINVGGSSDTEIHDKRERVVDAVGATKAALAEGIVPGAGMALFEIAKLFLIGDSSSVTDETKELISKMLEAPARTILSNSGMDPEEILNKVYELPEGTENKGYNVVTKEYGNLIEMGVIDPVKVTKLAVKHAISVASMLLTIEGGAVDEEEDKKRGDE